jgi:glycerophosphoryl diester phosphodiesterase
MLEKPSINQHIMKQISILITVIYLTSCAVSRRNTVKFAQNPVVAHRGAWKANNLPENSIASLREAIRIGCTGSEFDVRMTLDYSLVINHDPHYNKLEIEKTTYTELTQTKLSNGEKLPTLREYILAGLENNKTTRLVCEIKPSGISKERAKLIADKTLKLVKDLHAEAITVYISFDYDILKRIFEVNPEASTQHLNGDKSPEQIKADNLSGIDYHFSVFKKHPEWIEAAKKNKLILNAWTVNDEAEMKGLLENKFDFITTNEPELLFEILNKSK